MNAFLNPLHIDASLSSLCSGMFHSILLCALALTFIRELLSPWIFTSTHIRLPPWVAIPSLLRLWSFVVGHLSFPLLPLSSDCQHRCRFCFASQNNLGLGCSGREDIEEIEKIKEFERWETPNSSFESPQPSHSPTPTTFPLPSTSSPSYPPIAPTSSTTGGYTSAPLTCRL